MQSGTHDPGRDAPASKRPEFYRELRRRNERRARVARLLEEQRGRRLQIERVMQMQRARRHPQRG
ncbi:MAG: hypothetical protein JO342_14845 [Solirubrobacterales bacterium]|nr:hypothetical protein [Solirubrobacterales bacterium]